MIKIVSKFYIRSNLFRTVSLLFHFGRPPWTRSSSLSSWLPSVLVVAPSTSHDPFGLEVAPPLWLLPLSRFPLQRHHFPFATAPFFARGRGRVTVEPASFFHIILSASAHTSSSPTSHARRGRRLSLCCSFSFFLFLLVL
jgi:hypothetical protein